MELLLAGLVAAAGLCWLGWSRERRRARAAAERHRSELAAQRSQREIELREQAERTAALFDRMVEGLIVVDSGGSIRLANRAAGILFGFEPPAAGRTLLEAVRHHEVATLAARLEHESEVLGHEVRLEGIGAPRFLQINALALRARDGAREGAILVIHDLTRLRQLEAVRQEFVANVSHELRTPLSLVKSAVETLLDGGKDDPPTLERFLQIIERHANRLALVIDDLLLLSTLDSGRLQLQLEAVPIRSAVQESMDDLQSKARARGVRLINDTPHSLTARADSHRLRQVLSNLLDNAIKYGKSEGEVRVAARLRPDERLDLSVHDDGPGIPAEAQSRIFERFYRVDKARSREQGGTGLGLAIVKHVVQAHGGEVSVESSPASGTTFRFSLPAMPASG